MFVVCVCFLWCVLGPVWVRVFILCVDGCVW